MEIVETKLFCKIHRKTEKRKNQQKKSTLFEDEKKRELQNVNKNHSAKRHLKRYDWYQSEENVLFCFTIIYSSTFLYDEIMLNQNKEWDTKF